MVYNAETLVLLGITQNCYYSFGIPASLAYGVSASSAEFNLDSIISELSISEKEEEMRSPNGSIITLDTTLIQANYLLGQANSESNSENDYDDNGSKGELNLFIIIFLKIIKEKNRIDLKNQE